MSFFLFSDVDARHFSGSAQTGFPTTNLNTFLASKRWVSAKGSSGWIAITGSAAFTCDTIAFQNHNLSGVTCTLATASAASFADAATVATFTPQGSSSIHVSGFTAVSSRYWKLTMAGSTPRMACLYIAQALTASMNHMPAYNDADDAEYYTDTYMTIGGALATSQNDVGAQRFRATLRYNTEAWRDAFVALVQNTRGDSRPFYFVSDSSASIFARFMGGYNPVVAARYNLYDVQALELVGASTDALAVANAETIRGVVEPFEYMG